MGITKTLFTATHDSQQEMAEGRIVMKQRTNLVWKVFAGSILLVGLVFAGCKNPTSPDKTNPPSGLSPPTGSKINDTTPLLDWEDATGAAGYHVQVNTNDSFTGTMKEDNNNVPVSQYQVSTTLLDNTTYYWHVRVQNNEGVWSDWSGTWNFTVDIAPPTTPSPSSGSSINNKTPLLDWENVTDASIYHVQVNTNESFTDTMIVENSELANSHYQVSTTLADNTYYWHVRVQNEDGFWGDWGDIWSFTVDSVPPVVTTPPVLNSGDSYTRDVNVTISHSVSEATQMIMSENSSFSGSSWVTYQASPIYSLSSGDGTKTVYIKYRDSVGNETGTYSDTIVLSLNVYVSSSGSDSNAGTPNFPLLTLSEGISLAQTSMPVEVRVEGNPAEILYDLGSVGLSIPAGVSLMGGYNSDFSMRNGATYISKITSTNTYTILFDGSSVTNETVLDGFIITNTATFDENVYTVYCKDEASPKISNNKIGNESTYTSSSIESSAANACIFIDYGSPLIEKNEITGGSGGTVATQYSAGSAGIYCNGGNPVIQNNISIVGGNGTASGKFSVGSACIYCCSSSNASILNNSSIIGGSGNSIESFSAGSAGIYCYRSKATIRGNKLIDGGDGSASKHVSAGSVGIYYCSESLNIDNNEFILGGNGTADGQASAGSAGIFGSVAFSIISNNLQIIGGSGNSTGVRGAGSAGIYCKSTAATIFDNQIIDGGSGTASGYQSAGSAGLYCEENVTSTIYNNIEIKGGNGSATNSDSAGGVGIYCTNEGSLVIYNNMIIGESASATSNAIVDTACLWFGIGSYGKVVNNTLFHQSANEYSIGIYLGDINDVRIANNIIFSGDGTNRYGIYEDNSVYDPTIFLNNLIFDCPSGLYYDEGSTAITDISVLNALTECSDNITTTQTLSQLFVGGSPFDYHLASGSDAIDAGFNTSSSYWGEVTDDIDGETRPKGSAYDIGFDEY